MEEEKVVQGAVGAEQGGTSEGAAQVSDEGAHKFKWSMTLKLNYTRTVVIGLAFFSICLFWQVYNFVIPLLLQLRYNWDDFSINLLMTLSSLFAMIMLPLVGLLSDRSEDKLGAKYGKRMPFIVLGTIGAAAAFSLVALGDGLESIGLVTAFSIICVFFMATYRSPAVALMPDLTPKPLRSKANAIINIMGTVGGIIATLVLIPLTVYTQKGIIDGEEKVTAIDASPLAFILVGVIMLVSIAALIFAVRENSVKRKVRAESLALGYDEVEVEAAERERDKNIVLSKSQKISLFLILSTIFLLFMGYNAITIAASRYGVKVWGASTGAISASLGVAQIAGMLLAFPAALLASKVGRRYTILIGIGILLLGIVPLTFFTTFNNALYLFFSLIGIGWATISVNTFPMVVELAKGESVGRYTGLYYLFSMGGQTLTALVSGALIDERVFGLKVLFPYAAVFAVLALIAMLFVKHGDAK